MKLLTRGLLLFLFTFSSYLSVAAVTASFTASATSGCPPLVVHFTNTTTPMAGTTFDWDLGNGSGIIHLTHCSGSYLSTGTYTVRLTAHNGSSTSVSTMTITVLPSPNVTFMASDTTICPGTAVTFTSTATGGVPGPVTCTWNFGDGFSGTGPSPTHVYATSGSYNVTLSVTNASGCVKSLTKVGHVTVYTRPSPNFSASTTHFCEPPGNAVFTNSTTGAGPFTSVWRFGDGSPPSTVGSPTHTYPIPGTYSVTLIVTDSRGCIDSITRTGYIVVGNVNAAFTFPTSACINSPVSFPNTSSAHLSRTWDFGDGGTDTTFTGSHTYTTAGTYTVRLIVFDGFCYDTVTHPITIIPGPVTSFTISPVHPCPPPVGLTFTGTAPPGTLVTWLFGDGTTGSGVSTTHTYWNRGIYTIQMIAVNPSTGCRDTVERIDTLFDMVHYIIANPRHGCRPLSVNFWQSVLTWMPDSSSLRAYPLPVTSYTWDFGDGSPTSPASSPTHIYTAVGTYTAVLTSVTSNGCVIRDSVTVDVGVPPVITFTATPTRSCYNHNFVRFTATVVTGPVDSFVWIFGDGSMTMTSTGTTGHSYGLPGVFTVTVIPYYNGCPGPPAVRVNYITIDSPMAIIAANVLCSPARRVVFGDSSMGDDTHLWLFGDGATSTVDHPIHDYPLPIVYICTLYTYNALSGCRDTTTTAVDLRRPVVSFSCADTAICRDSIAVLVSTVTGGSISAYFWHSGGWSADSSSPTYIDTFHTTGRYTIRLITRDQNGCFDTVTRPNYILVAKPVANFTVSPPTGCWPLTTVFTDASTDVPGTFFISRYWEFGDGGTTMVASPSVTHTFTMAGTFTTTMIVTDNVGCKDTAVRTLVTVWRPTAVFTASNVHPCPWVNTNFINGSTGIVSSFWMFGDGGTSTATSPSHSYAAPGMYTVRLVVTDSHGCTDTATYVNYITVTKPSASFYMSDSVSICPPLIVAFHNTSTGAFFYNWDLAGSSSTLANPSGLYITTGYDTIRLIASDLYGCKDTAYGHINIFGYAGAFSYTPLTGCAPLRVNFYATTLNVPNIIWDFADGYTSAVSYTDTISHLYTLPGAYVPKLILSDNSGCQNSSLGLDTIKVNAVYPDFTTEPNPVCLGDTFYFVDSSKSFYSTVNNWNWAINGNTYTVPSPTVFIGATGTYPATLIVTDGWGCTATISKDVNVYDPPVITASPDTIICIGDAATLKGYGGVSYTWSPAATLSCTNCNPSLASPTDVTTYTVVGKDAHGCVNTADVTVSLKTHTESIARGDTEVCVGVAVQLFDSGGTKYTWIPGTGLDNPNIANPIASPSYTTQYMVIAKLAGCIADTNYVIVKVRPLPTVNAGPDQTLIAGSTAQLNATGTLIYKYAWGNSASLSCDTCANPVASMSVTTTYFVVVASDFGCINSDTVTIKLFCDETQLFIPNSFTPNNDGQNDVFYPRGTGVQAIKSFRIYNRWGQVLFERSNIDINDVTNAWDGSYLGGTPRPDVYVYVINAICDTGEPINVKGDVTIIR